jgi:Flp pilus assembly protein CpaB
MFKRAISIFAAALFAVFGVASVLSPAIASTRPPCQWVQVDADNDPNTPPVSVYGY